MIEAPRDWHRQHSDSPDDSDPIRPGAHCGPHCDLFVDPDVAPGRTSREDVLAEALTDAIDAALEAMTTVAEQLRSAERMAAGTPLAEAIGHFTAYHMADLEGAGAGWLAGPYLIDALRAIRDGEW